MHCTGEMMEILCFIWGNILIIPNEASTTALKINKYLENNMSMELSRSTSKKRTQVKHKLQMSRTLHFVEEC